MPTMGLCLESARRERWGVILAGGDGVRLRPTNFSKEILETHPERLAVLPVSGVGWTDLGDPRRVLDMRRQALREPDPLVA